MNVAPARSIVKDHSLAPLLMGGSGVPSARSGTGTGTGTQTLVSHSTAADRVQLIRPYLESNYDYNAAATRPRRAGRAPGRTVCIHKIERAV